MGFSDSVMELNFVIDYNLEQRNFTTFLRCQLGYNLKSFYEEQVKPRIEAGKKIDPSKEFLTGVKGRTTENMAKRLKVSSDTYQKGSNNTRKKR